MAAHHPAARERELPTTARPDQQLQPGGRGWRRSRIRGSVDPPTTPRRILRSTSGTASPSPHAGADPAGVTGQCGRGRSHHPAPQGRSGTTTSSASAADPSPRSPTHPREHPTTPHQAAHWPPHRGPRSTTPGQHNQCHGHTPPKPTAARARHPTRAPAAPPSHARAGPTNPRQPPNITADHASPHTTLSSATTCHTRGAG